MGKWEKWGMANGEMKKIEVEGRNNGDWKGSQTRRDIFETNFKCGEECGNEVYVRHL